MKMYSIQITDAERRLLVDALEDRLIPGKADAAWLLMTRLNELEADGISTVGEDTEHLHCKGCDE